MLQEAITFAQAHRGEDAVRLMLQRDRYPEVDMRLAVQQLEGMAQAPAKWPSWAACPEVGYPPKVNREQSSSEATARYKTSLLPEGAEEGADLTGGMGVDTYFMALGTRRMHYCEQDPDLCRLAAHNFAALGCTNILVHEGDSLEWLRQAKEKVFSFIYIDPARRDTHGGRVTAFEQCTPNLLECLPLLRSRCKRLLVKASPMLDLTLAMEQLGGVAEAHIVAVEGECKEMLLVCGDGPATIVCVNLCPERRDEHRFTLAEEQAAPYRAASCVQRYLYEPHAALMKGGCYRLLAQWYDLGTLDPHSHLYTADQLQEEFPGRIFEVEGTTHLDRKSLRRQLPEGKAHVVCRNYPVRADRLQQQLGLAEGGDRYLVATTHDGERAGLLCRLVKSAAR